ncbi:DUF6732 family protein [Pseudovibrio sp. Tun.PSC04-5.I4]|uniref:DUF6732 family protein n=1 Tax=Pseudovibrio sp. Tun.PSC04-5.I4 TaxID=1798213 RepID=UPI000891851A|nr:DUF6732 family protein [Pseudovibrio sp. Tun.PSC04-5.I4]SDR21818.1 hypothetical protein SAMN04515695_3490 [Pseudovibrio sp. Tun.PSC04-5.I4]
MSFLIKLSLALGCMGFSTSAAFAHAGHLGELAGHSHWVGIAAIAGAAIVAGIAARARKRSASAEDGNPEDARGTDTISPEDAEAEPA